MKTKLIILMILITVVIRSQDCVFVHGWFKSGAVWNGSGVKNVLDSEYDFNRILQPTLGGTYSAATQSLNLRNYLINNNVQNSLTISYSMGGMNTRHHLKRQFEQSQPGRIDYHFTIGSPHIGALIANNRTEAINRILIGCEAALFPTGYLSEEIFGEIIINYLIWDFAAFVGSIIGTSYIDAILNYTGGPALTDLEMGSPADIYINHPNTNYENDVIKVGIAGVEDYPQLYRLASNYFGLTEEDMLDLENYIKAYKLIFLIADFINYAEYPTPLNLAYLEESLGMYSIFDQLANTYNKLVSDSESGGDSDGIVQKNSQIYPNYDRQYYSNGANHIEELDNAQVLSSLSDALDFYGFGPDPLSVYISGPSTAPCATGTWYANVSGGSAPYSYQWYHTFISGGPDIAPKSGKIRPPKRPIDTWYPVGTNSPTLNFYLCGGNSKLKVDVTDNSGTFVSAEYYVTGSGGGGLPLSKNSANSFEELKMVPEIYNLGQNYPNPFNPTTQIKYAVKQDSFVSIKVYDLLGKVVATLVNESKSAGFYTVNFDASRLSSGTYLYTIKTNDFYATKKMIVLK